MQGGGIKHGCVNIHVCHVIHYQTHAQPLAVQQQVRQQRRLAAAKKARYQRHWHQAKWGRMCHFSE